jgi:hypothetical protein
MSIGAKSLWVKSGHFPSSVPPTPSEALGESVNLIVTATSTQKCLSGYCDDFFMVCNIFVAVLLQRRTP